MANRRFIDFPIAASVGNNDIVLIWQDGLNKQTTKATLLQGSPQSLAGLTDVDISALNNGQILQYNSTTSKWENVDRTDINLSELGDVTIVSPANGQVLVYNSSTGKWENSSGGYVPYTGAVTTVDLGAQGLLAGYIGLDTSVAGVPNDQGIIYWDDSRSTAALIMNGTLQHIGQDTFFYVKNSTGSSIPKGTAVRFNGTDGASGHLLIAPFLANGTYPSNYFMGVTAEAIANGSFGQVMHFGELTGVNTSGYTAGALLYASTSVAGAFQTTTPVAPNNIVLVAAAINSTNNGTILVRPTYGSNINQDEGVKITSGTTGDLLQLQAGGLWENKTLAQVIGSAYVPSTRTITINGTTQDLSANRTYNVGTVTSVGLSSATSGVTIGSTPVTTSGTITLAIATASGSQNGLLSSTDWTTFNSKQNALTNPVTGTGTSGQVAYFTGTSAITGESNLFWDATNDRLGIGINIPTVRLDVSSNINDQSSIRSINTNSGNLTSARLIVENDEATLGQLITYSSGFGFNLFGINVSNYTALVTSGTNSKGLIIGTITSDPVIFGSNNTEAIRIFSGQNVHIGPTPASDNGARLQVSGTGKVFTWSGATTGTQYFDAANTGANLVWGMEGSAGGILYSGASPYSAVFGNENNYPVQFGTNATIRMTITSGGNVGIGTSSPNYPLHINSSSTSSILQLTNSTTGSAANKGMRLFISNNDVILNNREAGFIGFETQDTERMRITSAGDLSFKGRSTTANYDAVFYNDNSQLAINANNTNVGKEINFNHRNDLTAVRITSTGELLAGGTTDNGAYNLQCNGTGVWGQGAYVNGSDRNIKDNISTIEKGLEYIEKINPVRFKYKPNYTRDHKMQTGFIAQELQEVFADEDYLSGLVQSGVHLSVAYQNLLPILVKAIQELKQEIDTLKN